MKKRILVIVPIAKETACHPVPRTPAGKIKASFIKFIETNLAAFTGDYQITDYYHQRVYESNKGDIAIGESTTQAFQAQFHEASISTLGWSAIPKTDPNWVNSNFDLVVLGGGGYLFIDSQGNLNSRANDILLLEKITIPVVSFGIGMNRLLFNDGLPDKPCPPSQATKNHLRAFCERFEILSVRDNYSREFLSQFTTKPIFMTGDPVLFYSPRPQTDSDPGATEHKRIGINVATHGKRSIATLRHVMPSLINVYRNIYAETRTPVRYFVHADLEHTAVAYLKKKGIRLEVIDGNTDLMLHHYRKIDFVINQMLHSSIFAFNVETPSINIAYDIKCIAFFELFGLERYCIPWTNAEPKHINELIAAMPSEREEIRKRIIGGKKRIGEARTDYFSAVKNLLNNGSAERDNRTSPLL